MCLLTLLLSKYHSFGKDNKVKLCKHENLYAIHTLERPKWETRICLLLFQKWNISNLSNCQHKGVGFKTRPKTHIMNKGKIILSTFFFTIRKFINDYRKLKDIQHGDLNWDHVGFEKPTQKSNMMPYQPRSQI